jgi:Domain of unknown function (DUF4276)
MTVWIEVLLEGASDLPTVREVLCRRFNLTEGEHFRLHPHRGKGSLPANPLKTPDPKRTGLLDQLPAKLRGYSKSLDQEALVLVVVDVDDDKCIELLASLHTMLKKLPAHPKVLFRLAIEETESWFIADYEAVKAAFPKAKITNLKKLAPDAIVGAWEQLAQALGTDRNTVTGADKFIWATAIAPKLNLIEPKSPSLRKLMEGIERHLEPIKP